MIRRTRVKICGLTRVEDMGAAITAGADAIGLVFYSKSARYVEPATAAGLLAAVPPFVTTVGLFVNASLPEVQAIVRAAPVSLLQFHGDETVEQCREIAHAVNRPYLRAVRIRPDMTGDDLLECEQRYRAASSLFSGLLLDAFVEGYGGGGKVFDWSLIPKELAPRVVLSGGLNAQNVAEAVLQVRPHALDVSSGVELSKGIKDPGALRSFIETVRRVDASAGGL